MVPQWSLSVVLSQLMFTLSVQLFATGSVANLPMQVCFLMTTTSTRRVSELAALWVDPLFLQVFSGRVSLKPSIQLLPKVVTRFHLSQEIILLIFFPSLDSENG